MIAASCLAAGALAHVGLELHLRAARANVFVPLQQKLASLPMQLPGPKAAADVNPAELPAAWRGVKHPATAALAGKIDFADDFIFRAYQPKTGGPVVELYAIYSRKGEDRKHHPEVCIREVAGAPEDPKWRAVLFLDAEEKRPVQRFRFQTGTTRHVTVYYWHYEFPRVQHQGQSVLQDLHQRLAQRPPSITVQVSTAAGDDDLAVVERSFLPAVDTALRGGPLPDKTIMACDRIPIRVIRD
jgi:hypothetical protein